MTMGMIQDTHCVLLVVVAGEVDVAPGLVLIPVLEGKGSVPVRVTPYKKKLKFKLLLDIGVSCIQQLHREPERRQQRL